MEMIVVEYVGPGFGEIVPKVVGIYSDVEKAKRECIKAMATTYCNKDKVPEIFDSTMDGMEFDNGDEFRFTPVELDKEIDHL